MGGLKESGQALAAATLVGLAGFAPPLLLGLDARLRRLDLRPVAQRADVGIMSQALARACGSVSRR